MSRLLGRLENLILNVNLIKHKQKRDRNGQKKVFSISLTVPEGKLRQAARSMTLGHEGMHGRPSAH